MIKLMPSTLPVRVAAVTSIISGFVTLFFISIALNYVRNTLEQQVTDEALNNAKRFASFTLGYFYYQDNFIHLETQQKAFSLSSDVLYSYIVSAKKVIALGISGLDSPDIGKSKQEWEPDSIQSSAESELEFLAKGQLLKMFPERLSPNAKVRLVSLPLNCEEQVANCASLKVAFFPTSHLHFLQSLTWFLYAIALAIILCSGIVSFVVARKMIIPLSRISSVLALSAQGKYSDFAMEREMQGAAPQEIIELREAVLKFKRMLEINAKNASVANTTQALAHDIRRPFTMFKMIIDAVEGENDPAEAKQLLKESLPEIQQAMASVNGMILDVLEIGSESAPIAEPTNPETLIESTLNEIFRLYPDAKINLTYALNHRHKVNVDTLKIGRVFSNIVSNAVQAMNQKGELWFKTEELEEDGKPFIKFCLGNGGSFIPPESLSKLFDAFFTAGKRGGTGLGLAIAQKIVTAHLGKIWCESDERRGVEFFFALPRANELIDVRPTPLPTSSAEITASFERLRKAANESARIEADPLEVTLEKEIIKLVRSAGAPLRVLVVDDEGVYRNSLAALINRSEDFKEHISLSFAKNSQEALATNLALPALIIQDVDLGVKSINGYEILKTLRSRDYRGVVCIHSNRASSDSYKLAMEAGADAVLPKPMSRTHFLKLMLQAIERTSSRSVPLPAKHGLLEFALLDDSRLTLRAWQRKIANDAIVHVFTSPDEFRAYVAANKDFLARLEFVVTDFYFAEGVFETGFSFAESLRPIFPKPILLCSDGDFTLEIINAHVDAVISKDPIPWTELISKVKKLAKTS